jgi:hypothetical protein
MRISCRRSSYRPHSHGSLAISPTRKTRPDLRPRSHALLVDELLHAAASGNVAHMERNVSQPDVSLMIDAEAMRHGKLVSPPSSSQLCMRGLGGASYATSRESELRARWNRIASVQVDAGNVTAQRAAIHISECTYIWKSKKGSNRPLAVRNQRT